MYSGGQQVDRKLDNYTESEIHDTDSGGMETGAHRQPVIHVIDSFPATKQNVVAEERNHLKMRKMLETINFGSFHSNSE
jgi:hypothetical protein